MRIREGDPLEIFTDINEEVIFKKYSPIGELANFADKYARTLAETAGLPTIITDKDSVVASSGVSKREISDKKVSHALEDIMANRALVSINPSDSRKVPIVDGIDKYYASVVCPIISDGDTIGTVAFVTSEGEETPKKIGETEEKLVKSAAGFLSSQMDMN
jgi:AbrB family transcriptional regulator (stage V sporulation protein T)